MATERPLTTNDLIYEVLKDASLDFAQKKALIDEIRKNSPVGTDRWTYRYAIWILGSAVALVIVCTTILVGLSDKPIPDGIIAIGSAAIGGLAGLLSSPSRAG